MRGVRHRRVAMAGADRAGHHGRMARGPAFDSLQRAALLAVPPISLAVFAISAWVLPDTPFIWGGGGAEWITSPRPVLTWEAPAANDAPPHTVVFTRRFALESVPAKAVASVKALRGIEIELNDGRWSPDRSCLKRACEVAVARWLRPGANVLRARVSNAVGPALLHLRLHGDGLDVATDARWQTRADGGRLRPARPADDRRGFDSPAALPTPWAALRDNAGLLALLFAASSLVFALRDPILRRIPLRRLPEVALGGIAVAWLYVFFAKIVHIPLSYGADGPHHTGYVRWIVEQGALPLADAGFQTYQPPLHYALSAALLALFEPTRGGTLENGLLKAVPFLSAFALVVIARALAARIFPGDHVLRLLVVLVAGTLPLDFSNAAYVSNEALHAALAAGALLAATVFVIDGRATPARIATLGAACGAAMATKYTAMSVTALVLGFVAWRMLALDRAGAGRTLAVVGGAAGVALLLAGWVYARNWIHFGDPVVWNLDGSLGFTYWQQPGFHTLAFFTSFGDVLAQPWFASFRSFWGGLYSTAWGEGIPPGGHTFQAPHALWNYELMALCYALAVPVTLCGVIGFVQGVRLSLGGPEPGVRIAVALSVAIVYALTFALMLAALRYPAWLAVRCKYLLAAVPSACLLAALGCRSVDRWLSAPRLRIARIAFWGWLGATAAVCVASFAA
jgi:hypothetical protein